MLLQKFLGLSHHKHSGKRLPHKHTSYAGLALTALFAGLVPALVIQSAASADPPPVSHTMVVTANVDSDAPVITKPTNEQRFTGSLITVSGTCTPGLIVTVYKNDLVAGSTPCKADGTFSLQINLLFGKNDLYAQHYRPGPVGPPSNHVIVYYDQAIAGVPQINESHATIKNPTIKSLVLKNQSIIIISDESVKSQLFGEELRWKVRVEGGQAPYALSWDWGDGSESDLASLARPGDYNAKHIYMAPGIYQITISATDTNGQTAKLHLVTIVTGLNVINRLERNLIRESDAKWLWWSMVTLLASLVCFWLGEHYQAWRKTPRRRHTKRTA